MRHNLQQGSKEWLDFRRDKIGASDAPVIMEESPYCSPYRLWEEKLELVPPRMVTDSMREGTRIEPIALNIYNSVNGRELKPAVLTHLKHDWMLASFDGLSDLGDRALEIKRASLKDHSIAQSGSVPDKYYGQLQHQMEVGSLHEIDYMSFVSEDNYVIVTVPRDQKYIDEMIDEESKFIKCMRNFEPPELTDKDYVERSDDEWFVVAEKLIKAKEEVSRLEDEIKGYRDTLIAMANDRPTKGFGVRLNRVLRNGSIKYSEIEEIKGVDLEKYRGKPSSYWRIDY